jgi:polyisoprenoid-binding protein YceI
MKSTHLTIRTLTIALLLFAASVLQAQSRYETSGAQLKLNGTSNLHDWESSAEKASLKTEMTVENAAIKDVKNVKLEIEVKSIKSSKGSIMDGKTYDALKAEKFSKITFQQTQLVSVQAGTITVKGDLSMAGVTKNIDLAVTSKILPNGDIEVKGSKKLKMTEFKIDPPTAVFGTIKTADEVTVSFTVVLKKIN